MTSTYEVKTATQEHVVRTRDGAVTTRAIVGGQGPALLYLHGLDGLEWSEFHDLLAVDNTVYAIEHVGSGDSTGLETLYDFWDLVSHYEEALDELELSEVALVGHSFGGMVAAELAAHLRGRVRRLVLISPLGLWDDRHPVVEIEAVDRKKRAQLLLGNAAFGLPRILDPDPSDYEAVFHAELNSASINQFSWPIAEKGLARRLYRVTAPTLLLWGQEDRIVDPVYAEFFASKLRAQSRVQLVPEVGHLMHFENPVATASAVRAHLVS